MNVCDVVDSECIVCHDRSDYNWMFCARCNGLIFPSMNKNYVQGVIEIIVEEILYNVIFSADKNVPYEQTILVERLRKVVLDDG